MGIPNEQFRIRDIFIDYEYEEVMFRFELSTRRFFKKFYGESKETEVPYNNRMLNDAIRFGDEVDSRAYQAGKPKT